MSESSRCVLITGVSRGLGRALVQGMAAAGHQVIGCARSEKAIEELGARWGSPHWFSRVDVSDDGQVQAWAGACLERGFVPDLLINNAALINRNRRLWEVPADEFSRVVDVNVKGPYHVIRHFIPAMIDRGTGVVVNLSSGWGRGTAPEVAPYCATKFAIEGMTQALAEELPPGMAAVPLNPGVIHTEMLESCFGASAGSYPTAEEWARKAVPFLLELSSRDNGRSLTV